MLDKVYVDKMTGEQVRIINEDAINYQLDNSVRIKKEIFPKRYDEQMSEVDPNTFFQQAYKSSDPLANLANQIKNLDTSKIVDNPSTGAQVKYTPPIVLSDNSMTQVAVKQQQLEESVQLTPEQKKAMLEEWRRNQPGAQIPEVQNRNYDEEEERFLNGDKPITVKPPEPKVDPIEMMFKMFKKNYAVKLNINIEENIPNPQFIAMIQENVDADAVRYYADLISDKVLQDPTKLKDEVYKQLKAIVNKELGIEEEKNIEKDEPK